MPSATQPPAYDVLVLGAGIIGTCTALHLQQRGRRVCLLDQAEPGSGTSYGNAGLIERSSVVPYAFPHDFKRVLRYALNREADVCYRLDALPGLARWLWRYWRESAPRALAAAARDMLPLIEGSIREHQRLIAAAGLERLIRQDGWIDVYRDARGLEQAAAEAHALSAHGLRFEVLDAQALRAREPGVLPALRGGVHWLDPWTITAPGELVQGYACLFEAGGGQLQAAQAQRIEPAGPGWRVVAGTQAYAATELVVALGPDSPVLLEPLGYRFPLALKRGYHLHYQPRADAPALAHPICDSAGGYVLAPMRQGIRLTTGIELARPGAAPSSTQIRRAHALASRIFPLGAAIEAQPWMGRRPCLPDMRPIIGPAPRHPGLWLNFGHAHHGMTLGAVSGRLLAELMTHEAPLTNPAPYRAARFL